MVDRAYLRQRKKRQRTTMISSILLLALAGHAESEERFQLIVNASNTVTQMSRQQVTSLFLDRTVRWKNREAEPVDQSLHAAIRTVFTREVLRRPVSAVQRHWEERMLGFHELPPPTKGSDEDVVAHVAKKAGGIGYVSEAAVLPATVKAIAIVD